MKWSARVWIPIFGAMEEVDMDLPDIPNLESVILIEVIEKWMERN